ncbi:glycosyl hydrolase [Antrihabitans stalactiti]|uniref:Asl1-like glycosyl hydrolase catalytic domain-containing protein n=1 Tax=Antrihabitans stalactiti TaxID=2584121 RepID=A0A848KFL8_9NOCA|nr:glycosyl hydrolase [Antrihabitans stalactiti]NMN97773.1 hypothetical protein [Antrihabitans stalactiti]
MTITRVVFTALLLPAFSLAACTSVDSHKLAAPSAVHSAPPHEGSCSASNLGVTAVTAGATPDLLDRQSREISERKIRWVRLTIEWPIVNQEFGTFDWTSTDNLVNSFHDRGTEILGVATWAPTWAVPPQNQLVKHPAPADPARFAEFVSIATKRYQNRIRTWEIWNEPNIGIAFGPGVNVNLYAAMLIRSYAAIKAIDPNIVVVSGATAPTVDNGYDLSPASFFEQLYREGAGHSFDAIAMHPYSDHGFLSRYFGEGSSANAIAQVRMTMVRNGDAKKKIWFTEFGATTGGPRALSEPDQAAFLVDGINYLKALPFCGGIFVFDYRDVETGSPVADFNYGLVRSDFTPKESLAAVLGTL